MAEASLETKQEYLRTHIIEAGHNPEAFMEYCEKTHDLSKLEQWTMQELSDTVAGFIASISSEKSGGEGQSKV